MKLALRIHFYTDGDYWIRNTDELFDPHCSMYKGAEVQYQHEEERDFGELWFVLTCEGEANACRWAARDLMEALAVNFSVTQTHYWLVKDLYDLVITPKQDFLWSREDIDRFWAIDGNYEGTELYLYSVYARGSDGEFHLHAKAVKEQKTRTNYDLFHEMKPYELADFLAQLMDCCFNSGRCGECDEDCPMYDCCNTCGVDNVEDWLMQEANEM